MIHFLSSIINTKHGSVNPSVPVNTSQVCPWLMQMLYPLGRNVVVPLYFGRISVTGQENLPKTGPVILAPTHRSRWDALVMPYAAGRGAMGRDFRFMISINECQGLQGWFVRRVGGFSVDPKQPSITTLRHSVELLQQQEVVLIFPEGNIYRNLPGEIKPLKLGLARIALHAEASKPGLGVQIVPIGISYSQPYPNWGTDVSVRIGSPVEVADYHRGSMKENAKQLTADITLALTELSCPEPELATHAFAEVPNS